MMYYLNLIKQNTMREEAIKWWNGLKEEDRRGYTELYSDWLIIPESIEEIYKREHPVKELSDEDKALVIKKIYATVQLKGSSPDTVALASIYNKYILKGQL